MNDTVANPLTFLIVDDEPAIGMALEMFVSREFQNSIIHIAENGQEAWRIAQNCMPDIILSDLSMPEMNGLEFCHHIRAHEQLKDTYFIILTAHLGKEQRSEALRSGADDFLTKPFSAEDLLTKLREAATQLQKRQTVNSGGENPVADPNEDGDAEQNKKQEQIDRYIALLAAVYQARVPDMNDVLKEVAELAQWIGSSLEDLSREQIHHFTSAARIGLIGTMFLKDNLLKTPVLKDGHASQDIMSQVPVSAANILNVVPELQPVTTVLRHVYENLDGSGFPDRLQAWQIPIGSRILRVALDYTLLKHQQQGVSAKKIAQQLAKDTKRIYESRIITLLHEYVELREPGEQKAGRYAIKLQELQEGMKLSADIITNSGLKLLPAGATLTQGSIAKIISHNTFDHIIGTIYVQERPVVN